MHKISLGVAALGLLLVPFVSSAHETRMYEINNVPYEIVMGSVGEPVIVDDKTGVEMEIVRNGVPFIGAADSLQVELIAGDVKKTVSLSPVHGAEGKYRSNFIATVPTTLSYRVFGTLEDTPIDVMFTCNSAGHPAAAEETSKVEIGEKVTQTLKRGSFGCPQAKEAFGFPESAPSALSLQTAVADEAKNAEDAPASKNTLPLISLAVSILAAGIAVSALKKK